MRYREKKHFLFLGLSNFFSFTVGLYILCWDSEPIGTCSIKTIHQSLVISPIAPQVSLQKDVVPSPTLKNLILCMEGLEKLHVGEELVSKNLPNVDRVCLFCWTNREDQGDLLIECSFSKSLWLKAPTSEILFSFSLSSQTFEQWFWEASKNDCPVPIGLTIAWYIWKSRKSYLFQINPLIPQPVLAKSLTLYHEWKVACDLKTS